MLTVFKLHLIVLHGNREIASFKESKGTMTQITHIMCTGTICEVDAHVQVVLPAMRILQCSYAFTILNGRNMHK